jgi:hypothetical protein
VDKLDTYLVPNCVTLVSEVNECTCARERERVVAAEVKVEE